MQCNFHFLSHGTWHFRKHKEKWPPQISQKVFLQSLLKKYSNLTFLHLIRTSQGLHLGTRAVSRILGPLCETLNMVQTQILK
jgi:hypothetical protein